MSDRSLEPVRTFVFVYYGRTGSSWLLQTIRTCSGVLVPGFEPLEPWGWKADDDAKFAWLTRALAPPVAAEPAARARWLESLRASPQFTGPGTTDFETVGFKMTLGAVADGDRLMRTLVASGARVVFLERDNRIKHALSLYRAHEEGKDQFTLEGELPPTKLRFRKFDTWLNYSAAIHGALCSFRDEFAARAGRARTLSVAYEEFIDRAGKAAVVDRVAGFLDLDPAQAASSSFRKVTPDELSTAVVNYARLVRRYENGPFGRFLTD